MPGVTLVPKQDITVTTGIAAVVLRELWAVKRDPAGTGMGILATVAATDDALGFVAEGTGDANGDIAIGDTVTVVTSGHPKVDVKDSETIVPGDGLSASTSPGQVQKLTASAGDLCLAVAAGSASGTDQTLTTDYSGTRYKV